MKNHILRRKFLSRFCVGTSALWTIPGAFAEALSLTQRQTEGPLYPDNLPLDTDNDLLVINETTTPAVGEVTHLSGRILDKSGTPVRNALVEIWQVDSRGVYIHSQTAKRGNRDKNFQGFGRFLTGNSGEYYFRTVKPPPYGGRARHIHFAVIHNNHGNALRDTGRYTEAREAYQLAIELDSEFAEAIDNLGTTLSLMGARPTEAEAADAGGTDRLRRRASKGTLRPAFQ